MTPPGLRRRLTPGSLLRAIMARRGAVVAPVGREWRRDLDLIRDTRRRVPLLMSDAAALHIVASVRAVHHLDGAMAEAGVLCGGSARLIAAAKGAAPLHLFDVFETLQSPATPTAPGEAEVRAHFGTTHGSRAQVEALLAPYPGVTLHPGVLPHSAGAVTDMRFAFVHLDLDLPGATREALAFFHPRLLPGGILIGDDYNDPDVRRTFVEWFEGKGDTVVGLPWAQVMVVRAGAVTA